MKTLCLLGACTIAVGQAVGGEFINLGFDEMLTNHMRFFSTPISFGLVQGTGPVSEVLQGWRLFLGTNEVEWADFNNFPMNPGYAIVYEQEAVWLSGINLQKPEGKYALRVSELFEGQGFFMVQTGDVPVGARVVQYRFSASGFKVFANEQELPFLNPAEYGSFAHNTLAAFAVSEFAGRAIELKLKMKEQNFHNASAELDSIEFATAEPPALTVHAEGSELAVTCAALDTEWLVEGARELSGSWERVTILAKGSTGFTYPLSGPLRFFRLRLGWDLIIPPMAAHSARALPVQSIRPSKTDTPVSR